jgi:transcriptional regulator with XRE-family HTH domain
MKAKTRRFSPTRLREARGSRSREEIAVAAGVTLQTVRNWEAGKGEPDATPLAAIGDLTEKPLDFFYESMRAAS